MASPLEFRIAVRDFDVYQLPADSRDPANERFAIAVAEYFARQFAHVGGNTIVGVDSDEIGVSWIPDVVSQEPLAYALSLLREGKLADAIPLLEWLLLADPNDFTILYNLGMAESDLGHIDKALSLINRAVEANPSDANAMIALGVAYQRNHDFELALDAFARAVALDSENGYAQRNLGAALGRKGDNAQAEPHLRAAARLLPEDQSSIFALAHCLELLGSHEQVLEADGLYKQVIAMNPSNEIAEITRKARTNLAQQSLRSSDIPLRMDAVFYCLAAMEKFDGLSSNDVQAIAFEIGMLGKTGIDVNSSEAKYTLRTMPGKFSGLHLMCYMYVGFKIIAPTKSISFDLKNEYETAQSMFTAKKDQL